MSNPPDPIFFDLQINGFAGVDFQQPHLPADALHHAVSSMRKRGIGGILLTLITDHPEALEKKLRHLEKLRRADPLLGEVIRGYHLEGPYLNPEAGYRGAHPEERMKPPEVDEFLRWQDAAGGNIRLLTLAPEWPGSPAFIEALRERGVHIALGHTHATQRQIDDAVRAGARLVTHLGNGVPQTLDRHDNVIQRLLAHDGLTACLIPDGIHLPPFVLKNFFRAKGPGRAVFVSDGMAAAGAPPGRYTLGALELEVGSDRVVRQPGQANFAGSALSLDEGCRNVREWLDLPPGTARDLCGTAPAALVGIPFP